MPQTVYFYFRKIFISLVDRTNQQRASSAKPRTLRTSALREFDKQSTLKSSQLSMSSRSEVDSSVFSFNSFNMEDDDSIKERKSPVITEWIS